ncbi:hypothetical protein KSS87_002589, partial [Heliosperma pusillum]
SPLLISSHKIPVARSDPSQARPTETFLYVLIIYLGGGFRLTTCLLDMVYLLMIIVSFVRVSRKIWLYNRYQVDVVGAELQKCKIK